MQEVPVRCYKQEPIKKSKSEKLTQKSSSKTDNNNKKKKNGAALNNYSSGDDDLTDNKLKLELAWLIF